ncbi:MAG: HupE/UreJ family protein [Myxococcota bacterium]|nr:HupE/UreJ family protein [Myxococcota bacterium]
MRRFAAVAFAVCALAAPGANGHEVRPAYLELVQTSERTFDVGWKVPARGEDRRFGLYVRLPADATNLTEPAGRFEGGAWIERWSFRHPEALVGATIHVDGLRTTLTDVLVRIQRLDGTTQVARLLPEAPSLVVEAAPGGWQVARTYLALGVEHILLGIDHLLFVLALLLLVEGGRRIVATVTAFTVAHSLTLAAATLGFVHVPQQPVEAVIALSIVFVAAEIVDVRRGEASLTRRWPWAIAFAFGLLHGLGFAGALAEIGLPEQSIPLALLFFNLGVEVGQLLFVAAFLVPAALVRRSAIALPAAATRLAAYGIGAVAAFWTIERVAGF